MNNFHLEAKGANSCILNTKPFCLKNFEKLELFFSPIIAYAFELDKIFNVTTNY